MKDKNVQRVVYEPHKHDRCNGCPLARLFLAKELIVTILIGI